MSTARQIINRSLRKVGALYPGEAADIDQETDALADLNAMLAKWLDQGIEISQGEVVAADTIPTDIGDEDAVVYNLAAALLPEYPNPNGNFILQMAASTYSKILTKYTDVGELQNESALLTIGGRGYNINTD